MDLVFKQEGGGSVSINGLNYKGKALDRQGQRELPQLRGELEEALGVAQRVEERMEHFESGLKGTANREEPR